MDLANIITYCAHLVFTACETNSISVDISITVLQSTCSTDENRLIAINLVLNKAEKSSA